MIRKHHHTFQQERWITQAGKVSIYYLLHHTSPYYMAMQTLLPCYINYIILSREKFHRIAILGIVVSVFVIFIYKIIQDFIFHKGFFFYIIQ